MKLQNRTTIPDAIVRDVLAAARAEARAPSTGVVVQVNQGRATRSSGTAYKCRWVRWGRARKWVACKNAIRIVMPFPAIATDPLIVGGCFSLAKHDSLACAESFYGVAAHEWRHIRDYNDIGYERHKRHSRHDDRPCERRANSTQGEAVENKERHADAILALAEALEAKRA